MSKPGAHFESSDCIMSPATEEFLSRFGGLDVGNNGPGLERTRERFDLEPMLCSGEEDRFVELSGLMERDLFPIGTFGGLRYFLAIDGNAEVYLIEADLQTIGHMPDALDAKVLVESRAG
ncbi:hypothetical protein ABH935_004114 [Catenulispora sp. GAS73]|uniref:SUKH-3 domain-containing protein n=1 Tax=Catenulispora sp. GAS73 TaxID=3156269 RepID=UPI00351220B7